MDRGATGDDPPLVVDPVRVRRAGLVLALEALERRLDGETCPEVRPFRELDVVNARAWLVQARETACV